MTADDITSELALLDASVARARHELANGAVLDLAPLERQVAALCAGIHALPVEQGRAFAPRLVTLFTNLESLGGQIREGRDALASELGELGKRRSAVNAYGRGT